MNEIGYLVEKTHFFPIWVLIMENCFNYSFIQMVLVIMVLQDIYDYLLIVIPDGLNHEFDFILVFDVY